MRHVVWFSCGAASAIAAKLAIEKYGDNAEVVYCDTSEDEHPDNLRFMADVEKWLGRPITRIHSDKFTNVDNVIERTRYMAGVGGARCTTELKRRPREKWQRDDDIHIFGFTVEEHKRANDFEDKNPTLHVEHILIDQFVTKRECLNRIGEAGIQVPAMYLLGFDHNNCLGCVKATGVGYWNRIRRNFPEVFAKRVRQSRLLGVRLVRLSKDERIFLDELSPDLDGPDDDIECGPVCQMSFKMERE